MIATQLKKTTSSANATAEIDCVLSTLVATWNHHDVTANAALFTENADFVNVVGMRMQGRKEIEALHSKLHQTLMRNSVLCILDRSVRFLSSEVALAHVRWEMTGSESVAGWNISETRRGVFTFVLVREKGRWLVTGAHNTDTIPVTLPN